MKTFFAQFQISKVIKRLILVDLIFWSGWGLLAPIFAVFLIQKIEGATLAVVGLASGIYWVLKSLLVLPIGIFLDSKRGEEDDFWFLFFGLILNSLVPFGYLMAKVPFHIYLLEALHALGVAMSTAAWGSLFTKHVDEGKEATEWSLENTSVGLGVGICGVLGGMVAQVFGFKVVFLLVGFCGILAALLVLATLKFLFPKSFKKGSLFSLKGIFQKER